MGFEVYRTSNNIKRRPDDGLIESECARFKVSEKDYAIVKLPEIKRFMIINPVIQFKFCKTEVEAVQEMENWQKKFEEMFFAKYVEKKIDQKEPETTTLSESYVAPDGQVNTQIDEVISKSPEQIIEMEPPEHQKQLIKEIKEVVPDRWPGRSPTISTIYEEGGFWTSTQARTVSSIQPIYCPTVRFDLETPELYFQLQKKNFEGTKPSLDAITHAYLFAGIDFLKGVITIPYRVKKREDIDFITDAEILINDLNVADFILSQILDKELWKNKEKPFVVAFGRVNSMILFSNIDEMFEILKNAESFFFI